MCCHIKTKKHHITYFVQCKPHPFIATYLTAFSFVERVSKSFTSSIYFDDLKNKNTVIPINNNNGIRFHKLPVCDI